MYISARTATERRLLAIWERLLEARPIGVHDRLTDSPGRPAVLDRMLAEIRREFGVFADGFPVNAFIEEPTIEALGRLIDGSIKPSASLVVSLQPHGLSPALFLIHAGGGYVFFYRALAARLGTDRPVFGIRAESNADRQGRPYHQSSSVEEVAARYLAEIRTAQPRGPYSLGGACVGGVIAFEMARQLRSQGESVMGPVLLFDAFMRNNPHLRRDEEADILRRMGILPPDSYLVALGRRIRNKLSHVRQLGLTQAAGYVLSQVLRNAPSEAALAIGAVGSRLRTHLAQLAVKIGPKAVAAPDSEESIEVLERRFMEEFLLASDRLQADYVPGDYPGGVVLFKAKDSINPERLWVGLAHEGMVVHELPGVHLDMMEEPAVGATAKLVHDILRVAARDSPAARNRATSAHAPG